MSFFGKLKGSSSATQPATAAPVKKDPNAPVPTPLEKHLADATGSIRPDGSDKFFGFENYGSTWYAIFPADGGASNDLSRQSVLMQTDLVIVIP